MLGEGTFRKKANYSSLSLFLSGEEAFRKN